MYAGADPADLASLGRIAGGVVGQVSLWGRVVEHSRGHRATAAYPARLRLVCVECLSDGHGVPATRVDHDRAGGRTRLAPLCEEHAGGRPLPASSPVEGQLLAAYQVERLPDEALGRITRRPAASSRPRVLAVAAALAFVVIGLAFVRSQRPDGGQTAAVAASPALVGRDTSGANLPYQRSNDGTVASITSRYQYLSPFDEMRCGRATPRRVVRTTCKDPASNAFIGQLVRGGAGSDACDTRTIAAAEHRDRVACWWGKPDGATGTGHTFLKNG